jgi:hypothetical protein
MKPDFEHIKKLWTIYEGAVLDHGAWMAAATELRTLPKALLKALSDLESADSDAVEAESPEFERVFRRYYKQESPDTGDDTGDDPDDTDDPGDPDDSLLPFPGFEGYVLDDWGRPHGMGKQGQKTGPLAAIKQWKPGRKPRFIFGYRLYREGKRVYQSALQCAIARLNVETAPEKAQYLADKARKGRSRHTKT